MISALAVSSCLALASAAYQVKPDVIEAVLSAPAHTGGIGPMHIPQAWLPILARVGFSPAKVERDRCTNIEAGTWILAYEQLNIRHSYSAPPVPKTVNSLFNKACVKEAAQANHIPVSLFFAVLRTEGGQVGQIHMNRNGSYDMGPAQINSIWLPVLAKSGITREMVLNNACLNISIGAWILGQSMDGVSPRNPEVFWQHVGDYNSHTPELNHEYDMKVWNNLR